MIELLLWPLVAGFVLAGIHAYFGMHVLARGVVFVDLSLAQVAALGLTIAILAGHSVQSEAGYWYAFAFAIGGAALFALARPYEKLLQQEAVIGIVYAVSASIGAGARPRTAGRGAHQAASHRLDPHRHAAGGRSHRASLRGDRRGASHFSPATSKSPSIPCSPPRCAAKSFSGTWYSTDLSRWW